MTRSTFWSSARLPVCVATLAFCLLAPAAATASELTYTRAPGSPLISSPSGGSGLAFSPSGALLARGTEMFSVAASGALTPLAGSPPDPSASSVVFSPSGAVLAAANQGGNTISMFSVGSSGALTSVPGSPFALAAEPRSVVFSPSGGLLAVTAGKEEAQSLYVFSVGASGALTPAAGSPYSVNSSAHVAFSATGSLLAVQLKTAVKMFTVSSSGSLTEVPGSPFQAPESISPKGLAFRSNGNLTTSFLSSEPNPEVLTTYSVASSGALTQLASGAGTKDPQAGAESVFSPDGSTIVAPQMDSSYFYVLSVSQSGAVTVLPNEVFSTGPNGDAAVSAGGLLALLGRGVSVWLPSSTSASTNWLGALGSDGYDLAAWNGSTDLSSLPNASVSLVKGTRCLWAANTSNVLALTSPDGLTRTAAGYCDPEKVGSQSSLGQAEVTLTFSKAYTGNLRVYSVLWEGAQNYEGKPHESITVGGKSVSLENNAMQGNPSFSQGGWALFPISEPAGGSLTISAEAISGIFLGDAPAAATTEPEGSWAGAVGSAGYDLADWGGAGDVSYMPGASLSVVQGSRYQWSANTTDARALQSPDALKRSAAAYYDPNQIQLKLSFPTAYTGNLHLYALDWDSLGRREVISVNGQSAVLSSDFTNGAWVSFPVSVGAGGTVTITVTRTAGPNAVLSGIFLGDAGAPPSPAVSSAPQGAWVNAVGSAGYDLAAWNAGAGDVGYLPNGTLNVQQGSRYQWAANTADPRALPDPGASTRNAGTYYDPNQIQLQLSFPAAYTGNLHLYALDWDSLGRREIISVNGQSAVLSSDFTNGAWVSFPISVAAGGTVSITVTRTAGPNAVLSGVFLGDAGAPPGPTVASAPQGAWVNAVGSAGYDLAAWNAGAGDVGYLPNGTLNLQQGSRYQWAGNTADPRALSDPGQIARNAGTYYDSNQIQLRLSFPAGYSGNLHLYAVDWDSLGRREVVSVNGQSAVLSSDFTNGAWVSFPVSVAAGGTVTITVTRTAGPNAVLSGVFLGDAGAPPGPTVSSAPQGAWVNAVGSGGYDLAAWNGSNDVTSLSNASLAVEQASRYQWSATTSDTRALQNPDKATREAATYYDPNEIKLKLSFPAAYTGNLHLYAVDWDSLGRREVVSVNGQSAALSSDFTNGAWVSFPVSVQAGGTVSIAVSRLAGPNAVLSGIFLGDAGPPPGSAPQGSLIPLYDNGNQADWAQACSQTNATGGGSWIIADVAEGQGPGSASVPAWANLIANCRSYGRASVIGYVWTDYGEGGPASIASIESQVNAWYSYYPGQIAGIFFDGVSDDVPGTSTSNQSFYRTLASYVHTQEGNSAEVVFNFGANPGSDWMLNSTEANNANMVVTFEGSYNTPGEDPYTSWTQAAWEAAYPAHDFAALIYNAPDEAVTPQAISACSSLAKQNIGYSYVGTWYSELPPYFQSFLTDSFNGGC